MFGDNKKDTIAPQSGEREKSPESGSGERAMDAPQFEKGAESIESSGDGTASTLSAEVQGSTHTSTLTLAQENKMWYVQDMKDIYDQNLEHTEWGGFKQNIPMNPASEQLTWQGSQRLRCYLIV